MLFATTFWTFLYELSARSLAKPQFEACHAVSDPPALAAVAPAAIIQSCLQQLKFDEDTIIEAALVGRYIAAEFHSAYAEDRDAAPTDGHCALVRDMLDR